MTQAGAEPAGTVVQKYFNLVKRRDPGLADLFHDEASLYGLGGTKTGIVAIREFYTAVIKSAGPMPSIVGDLLVAGDRVAAELEIALDDGGSVHAVDLFVVDAGRIRSLTYFIADHGAAD